MVGLNYAPQDNPLKMNNFKEKANISVYAKNKDYHIIIKNKLPTSASNLYAKNVFNFVSNLYDKENKKINKN